MVDEDKEVKKVEDVKVNEDEEFEDDDNEEEDEKEFVKAQQTEEEKPKRGFLFWVQLATIMMCITFISLSMYTLGQDSMCKDLGGGGLFGGLWDVKNHECIFPDEVSRPTHDVFNGTFSLCNSTGS